MQHRIAVLIVVGLVACDEPGGGNGPSTQGGAWSASESAHNAFWREDCRCDFSGFDSTAACIEQFTSTSSDAERVCREAVVVNDAALSASLACTTAALRAYTDCAAHETCEERMGPPPCESEACLLPCGDGTSYDPSYRCDGADDCENGADEQDCGALSCSNALGVAMSHCDPMTFAQQRELIRCADRLRCGDTLGPEGTTGAQYCDGHVDCPGSEDEANCPE